MSPGLKRYILAGVVAAIVIVLASAAIILATRDQQRAGTAAPAATPFATKAQPPAAASPVVASSPQAAAPSAASPAVTTKPTSSPLAAKPTAATAAGPGAAAKANTPADVDRARIARDATWTPGQLQSHFDKHGREGPWASESVYDASAREAVMTGTYFTYVDRESNAERLGFYDKPGNRFTSVTRDGRRITTHFRPDRGESYVRGLNRSTYR